MSFMKNFLSKEEKEILKSQHKKERDRRVCDRIKAVLLHDEGWSYQEIAHALLLTDESVRQHAQDYRLSQKLKPENGGSDSKLNKEQTEELLKHLSKHTYLYAKDILTNTGRQRLNLSGAIDIISKKVFVREDTTLNTDSTIAFLKELEAAYPEVSRLYTS